MRFLCDRYSSGKGSGMSYPAPSPEAERYSTAMWQHHVGYICTLMLASEPQRRAFVAGFNEEPKSAVHHSAHGAWERGRHSAILLGYISDSDGTATAAACEDMPVPNGTAKRGPSGIAQGTKP